MAEVGKYAAVAIIALFALIILWGKTPPGNRTLSRVLGEPGPPPRSRNAKSKSTTRTNSTRSQTAAKRSSEKKTSAKKASGNVVKRQ